MIGKEKEILIVDYKFASSKNNLERYSNQINEYKSLLEAMGFKIVKPYLWFISFEKDEFVSEIIAVK